MTRNALPEKRQPILELLDEVIDHMRGPTADRLIVEYGDCSIQLTDLPEVMTGCEDCLAIGGSWVHLRVCHSGGRIARCDSSPHRHASAHARSSAHPIASSAEPGKDWSWCYLGNVAFVVTRP
jgi:hypothetical protein